MPEVMERVHEQMWTTAETMRRRIVSFGDEAVKIGGRTKLAGERLNEVAEPVFLDVRDYVTQAYNEATPYNKLKEDDRHTLVEMYLGTSVLLIALSLGELAGHSSLLEWGASFFLPPWAALLLLLLLPARAALNFRKNALDDTERRTSVFVLSFVLGFLGSYLMGGHRLLALCPSLLFLSTSTFALLVDNELFRFCPFSSRQSLFMASSAFSLALSSALAYWPLHARSYGPLIFLSAHSSFLTLHAQVSAARLKDKALCPGFAQLLYVIGVFAMQAAAAVIFIK